MKALTLTQPWATLIAIGAKRIETRSWYTLYRGPIAIHAGKGPSTIGWPQLNHICNHTEPFKRVLQLDGRHPADVLPIGAVVAVAELVDCVRIATSWTHHLAGPMPPKLSRFLAGGEPVTWELTEQERAFGDYSPGRYAWLLDDVRALPVPVPTRGAQGLWDWDETMLISEGA